MKIKKKFIEPTIEKVTIESLVDSDFNHDELEIEHIQAYAPDEQSGGGHGGY